MKRKVKICEIEFYEKFGGNEHDFFYFGSPTEERKLKKKDKTNYDGPLQYIKACKRPCGLPEKENVRFCIKLNQKELKRFLDSEKGKYKLSCGCSKDDWYNCYTYQYGQWWKNFEPQNLFLKMHVPLFDEKTYLRICDSKIKSKFLSPKYEKTFRWWGLFIGCRNVGRSVSLNMRKLLRKND
jgi:hypothetical protein